MELAVRLVPATGDDLETRLAPATVLHNKRVVDATRAQTAFDRLRQHLLAWATQKGLSQSPEAF